jgi:hypothetical protein
MADGDASRQLRAMAELLTPMTIRIAATLGIADRIAAGMATAVDLAAAAGVRSDPLARLSERAGLTVVAVHPAGKSQILELRGR